LNSSSAYNHSGHKYYSLTPMKSFKRSTCRNSSNIYYVRAFFASFRQVTTKRFLKAFANLTQPLCVHVCEPAGGPGSWCVVYCWGAGMSRPTLLPRPNTDVHITQVSAGRQQMAAVTQTGLLLLWEVCVCGYRCLVFVPKESGICT